MSERESAKFYWLQLREEFFESDEIDWLEEQPNGPAQVLFYLKLCLKSLKTDGLLVRKVGQMLIPYDAEKLAVFTKTDVNTVQCAIVNLKMCGLVEVLEDGTLFLSHLTNLIGSQSVGAMKRQQQRARQKEAKNVSLTNTRQVDDKCRDKCPPEYRDKRLETRREDMGGNSAPLDDYDLIADEVGSEFDVVEPPPGPPACNEEKDQGSRMPPCPYDRIVTLYHEILPELPRVATLTSKRRSWITARWRSVCTTEKVASQADGLDLFRGYFSLVRKSPFLMGLKQPGKGHSRTFKADLEWLMNESNFTKVVEGKYA
jgi:predicted phage replisome organizer